ncbi:MAG: cobyrinate a,c-diamide synthase [Methanocorpusculum sp.]|nr:cobyrinate a,c-diamide synthase [Methanocorpusculum sp.]MDE2524185.1 cobyrinate a,c-diamide synthase [Methanocorpusculum sp.]
MNIPRIVIAGTHSGCGKTTTASGIMTALVARGLTVQPFKVGPDFIDPSHHTIVCGRESRNLDPFMMGDDGVRDCFVRACKGADIAVIEGVMGLYDGVDGSDCSSTAHVARLLDAPIILVADIKGMSLSVAALIKGYTEYDPRLRFAGVIMTKGGSDRHKAMTTGDLLVPLLGWMPRSDALSLESRHLGLVMGGEDSRMRLIGSFVEEHCDLDAILTAAGTAPPVPDAARLSHSRDPHTTIAVAMDAAFCFYYRDNFDHLRAAGAELIFFSPIADPLPQADAYYFGGGYPEIHAKALAASPCKPGLLRAAETDLPIFGECGGLMWLSRSITTADGITHPMTGLLDADAVMEKRFAALNYVIGTTTADSPVFPSGMHFRGHEFHYSRTIPDSDIRYLYSLQRGTGIANGQDGICAGSVLGGYTHIYFGKTAADAFCKQLTRQ